MLTEEQRSELDGWCRTFSGHISIADIAKGIVICLDNARALYSDALILFERDRYSRSRSLFISGMEEIGKISVLRSMARIPKENQTLWKEFWQDFRRHTNKTARAFVHMYPDELRHSPGLTFAVSMEQDSLSEFTERIRQAGLYVDYHAEKKQWVSPAEVSHDDAEFWRSRVTTVLNDLETALSLGLFSSRALSIQRDVFGPINAKRPKRKDLTKADAEEIRINGIACQRQYWLRLVEAGVLSRDSEIQIMGVPLSEFTSE
ncbi:AbiV family abortive infection protein [Rosistilla oblonga]|uniref:AbiV family abortive infection protein n=1 Tax=Rosistilla oblonga TaxID=2527990 RepID=UPI003A9814F8